MSEPTGAVAGGRAVLFGYLGGENLGDDAMLAGLLSLVRPDVQVTILARDPRAVDVGSRAGVSVLKASLPNALRAILASDFVVRVGGTSFHDEYEGVSHRTILLRYIKLCALYAAPRLLGKKVSAIGVGAGRITTWYTRLLSKIAMSCCAVLVVRDVQSLRLLRAAGHAQAVLGVDLAYALRPAGRQRSGLAPDAQVGRIGVSTIDLSPYGLVADNGAFWRELGAALASRYPAAEFSIYAFKDNEKESDLESSDILAGSLGAAGAGRRIVKRSIGLAALMDDMSRCDIVVASRYHSAILASLHNVPMMIIPYNEKLQHFVDDHDLGHNCIIDMAHPNESVGRATPADVDLDSDEFAVRYGRMRAAVRQAFERP